jgi:uncharacterized membrane protein
MSVSVYSTVLFLHVVAAMLLIGGGAAILINHGFSHRARTAGELRSWFEYTGRIARLNPLYALVLLVSGIWLGSAGWWSTGWFWVAAAAWVVNGTLAATVVKKSAASLGRALGSAGDGPLSPESDRLRHSRVWPVAERVMLSGDFAILYVMMEKPSAIVSAAVLAGAMLFALATGLFPRANAEMTEEPAALVESPGLPR